MRLLVAGDTHANTAFVCQYLYPMAVKVGAEKIVQVGDFGYWEHEDAGVEYLDAVAEAAADSGIPLYWLNGNHDKWSLAVRRYGPAEPDGHVIPVRPNVYYLPNGHVWEWSGTRMRVFGGAYSVDKAWRLEQERTRYERALRKQQYRYEAGHEPEPVRDTAGTLWFPEEELSDIEFEALLADDSKPCDVIFSHDKPRSANPGIPLKNDPLCWPNQDRLQRALLVHQPSLWVHGHLHYRYSTTVRCGDGDRHTRVVGLSCDDRAASSVGYRAKDAWCVIDLIDGESPQLVDG